MWKKLDNAGRAPLEFGSNSNNEPTPESISDMLMGTYAESEAELTDPPANQRTAPPEPQGQQLSPATLATYTEAVSKFTKNATALLGYLPLLADAREAYEQAMKASMELRKILDSGDENLHSLMTQLEQMVNTTTFSIHGGKAGLERKRFEPQKVEAIRTSAEAAGGLQKGQKLP
jgi:hypothetical protein